MRKLVPVPVSLLQDLGLLLSAKLVWLTLCLHLHQGQASLAVLSSSSGLSRPTVRKALRQLIAAGWAVATPGQPWAAVDAAPAQPSVTLPAALLADQRVGVPGRLLYGLLQATPGFRRPSGQFTYTQLSGLAGLCRNAVKRAVRELVQAGWLEISQRHQLAPVSFTCTDPELARAEADIARVQQRLHRAAYGGEAIMREYLSLIVDSDRFEDNAAPGFLVNPFTDQRLQLDRYYTHLGVAWEFNGAQHYGPTALSPQDQATKQRGRDLVKMGLCVIEGITLKIVHAEDLTLRTMQAKVGNLPKRDLRGQEAVIAFLESVSRTYRRAARRGRQSDALQCAAV